VLWIKGDPGKGKTMLLCGIIDEMSALTRLRDKEATTLLSYFFCQAELLYSGLPNLESVFPSAPLYVIERKIGNL
jgi:hypothetical protein